MRSIGIIVATAILSSSLATASFASPSLGGLRSVASDSHIDLVASKKKAKKKKDKPGKCGTMKYYDKKKKKCVSK